MIRVGLTGGIGAGKSTAAKTFVERGAYHIDADKIAREIVEPGTPGLTALVTAFGAEILTADGSLDRAALAAVAFVDETSRTRLNAITHPLIGARTQQLLDDAPDDAVVIQDIPLLVEGNMAPFFHLVVIVHADADLRLRRLTTSRGMPEDDARARIAAQASDDKRRAVADVWLDNAGTPADLAAAAAALWDRRLVPFEAHVRRGMPIAPDPGLIAAEPNPATLGSRVVNRLWAVLGSRAGSVTLAKHAPDEPPAEIPSIAVTLSATAGADVATVLAAGGFPPVPAERGRFGSADPGRPVAVQVNRS
ncbi:MAG: dephospho-CoA kinase [Gordonia sp. (in: high G+C Gram-positive bacteria)]